ncbi:MAG TPA: hypothetical protein PK514_02545 [Spirochaetota bacterium]|nr:hypothetical protein [Spirochaetota bacterium]
MKRLKIYAALTAAAILLSMPTLSQDKMPGKGKQRKGDINSFSVYLKMEKLKFYSSEDVILHVVIKNITDEVASFYVFDPPGREDLFNRDRGDTADYNTFKPVMYDMNGRSAELIVPYIVSGRDAKETLSWMTRREVRLGPGESFTRTLNLGRMYRLQSDTDYRIKLHFFPFIGDPDEDKISVSDNELKVRISRDREYQPYKSADVKGVRLVPSEVVILLMNAEKDGYWDRAIKFIDIEKFIHSYPDFSRKYDLADASDKKIIEKDFIRYFISKRSDYLIDFKVVSEEVEPSGLVSYVSVVASRNSLVKPDRYRYVYRLEKNSIDDYIWMVAGLEATVVREVKK